jgi:tetratricopeptide (TPR) repeat protein
MQRTYEHEGTPYTWTGKLWVDDDGVRPCVATQQILNDMLSRDTIEEDLQTDDPNELSSLARRAMDAGQLTRALRLMNRALERSPRNEAIAAAAVAMLRKAHRSDDAVPILQRFRQTRNVPLLVTGAAVLCDVERWEDALIVIRRALAVADGKSGEAFAVWRRIKSNRPDLFA